MVHQLPDLPYARTALEPHISAETIDYHYGKHHQAYVTNLNGLIDNTSWEDKPLEDIIRGGEGGVFNNAAQVFNHSFYWQCLSPHGGGEPGGDLAGALSEAFGSFGDFKQRFTQAAAGHFGSGWAWLSRDPEGKLEVSSTANAGCPIRDGMAPLLTCDVWEHAYYIDYRNARPKYIEAFWNLVNWSFVEEQLTRAG
jgi:Fe-Mn family superoxide dismutase